ncbi:hypothetical protein BBJ28_00011314 [Nothophytophthora sp. Chile5]|nr:hypothetical protein BBJ28_00011314 [Nothophytophthora sp. Chile5]
MWTVLFGDQEDDAAARPSPVSKPGVLPVDARRLPSPQHSTPPVTPSPLDEDLQQRSTPSTPPPRRRSSMAPEPSDNDDDSPMAMLLKRLNNLMIKVGEHEFEKKTLVDQVPAMGKERQAMAAQISVLEHKLEDLKDQNVQLQYKVEYTSEPMLLERVQDITDMRCDKDKELTERKTALEAKDKELTGLREQYEQQLAVLSAESEAVKQQAADAANLAEDAASAKYKQQLEKKSAEVDTLTELNDALEASLAKKARTLEEAEAAITESAENLAQIQAKGEAEIAALQQELEQTVHEQEQELQSVRNEAQENLDTLERHAHEQETLAAEKTQELEDYKHDCLELWKLNEDLKQQIALTSAETMLKHAELRENALSGQSLLEDKVAELEKQLETLQEQLDEKTQQIADLHAEAESRAAAEEEEEEVSGEDDDKFVVVEAGGGAIGILTSQVANAQRELTEAMELNLHLNNRNAWLEEQYQMLSSVQSDVDEEQEEPGTSKTSLEEQVAMLERELLEAQRAANEQMQHAADLGQNYSALSGEFERIHAAHSELIEVKRADDVTLTQLSQELETLRAAETNTWCEKDQELTELRTANATLAGDVDRFHDVEHQLQQAEDALTKAQQDFAEATASNSTLQRELDELKALYAAALQSDDQVAAIQSQLKEMRSEKEGVTTELTRSQTFIHDLQLKIHELEGIVDGQMTEKSSLEQQLQNLQEVAQENMEGAYELQAKLEDTLAELEQSWTQLRAAQDQCENLQHAVTAAEQSSAAQDELERAQNELASLEQQVRHLHDVEQSLNQQLQEAAHAKEGLAAELQAVRIERSAAEDEHKKLQASYEHATAQLQAIGSTGNERQRENDELSLKLDQTRAKVTQMESQVESMRGEHKAAQMQTETLTKKNLSLISEVQGVRDEAEKQQREARGQLEQLKAAHSDLQRELANATQALQSKEAEVATVAQRSQADVAQLEELVGRYKADKQSSDQRLAQLQSECEQLRQAHGEGQAAVDRSRYELEQLHAQMDATQQEKAALETEAGQLRGLSDEKTRLLQQLQQLERVNQRLEETNRELESTLHKSKAFCEELSRGCEDKVTRAQEFARHVEQEARDEMEHVAQENGTLRSELAQLAQVRFEETGEHDELRVKLAELQAENNVLAARAHRLTQQLSQYTDLPDDDELAASGQSQSPDLWELLSSGMEQLKADLELASKYAASIDASSVDGRTDAGGDEPFAPGAAKAEKAMALADKLQRSFGALESLEVEFRDEVRDVETLERECAQLDTRLASLTPEAYLAWVTHQLDCREGVELLREALQDAAPRTEHGAGEPPLASGRCIVVGERLSDFELLQQAFEEVEAALPDASIPCTASNPSRPARRELVLYEAAPLPPAVASGAGGEDEATEAGGEDAATEAGDDWSRQPRQQNSGAFGEPRPAASAPRRSTRSKKWRYTESSDESCEGDQASAMRGGEVTDEGEANQRRTRSMTQAEGNARLDREAAASKCDSNQSECEAASAPFLSLSLSLTRRACGLPCAGQRRQEASKDALLLKNRIALLKAEEEKAWKKIEQTRRRATELLKLRQDNDRAAEMLRGLAMEVERETQASIQVKRELVLSIDSIPKKKEISQQLTEARRCEAQQLKEDKQRWKEIMDRQKRDELHDAIRRKEEVENQKEALRAKKMQHKQDVDKLNRERALEKLRAEEEQTRQREAEVQDMERQELELIQRLRNTQHLQKQAFEELEAALSGGTGSGSSPS